jgi:hypothetical protein
MLVASLLHATWHSRIKSGSDQVVGLAGMGLVAAVAAIPFAAFLPALSITVWMVIGASVVLHVSYKLCLSIAYDHGDLGQAFPMARGAVPLFATLIAWRQLDRRRPSRRSRALAWSASDYWR